jgi:uncharacterized protein (DUF1501 family)
MNRRDFLKQSGLASGYFLIPAFLKPLENFGLGRSGEVAPAKKNLVVIQFSGGNDGLNTIIPYNNDLYYKLRKNIGIKKENVITLDKELGLNPAMKAFKELYDQGYVSIINNVGYPNPDRSHFRSMDIWQSASASNDYLSTGWLGRYLDNQCRWPYEGIEIDTNLSLALKGKKLSGIATNNARQLYEETKAPYFETVSSYLKPGMLDEDNLGYLYKTMQSTTSSAKYIFETQKTYKNIAEYPDSKFSKELKTVATFINSGLNTSVYYVNMTGFDTHVGQLNKQESLLTQYSEGVAAFVKDLKESGKLDDTLIITFSEFGRRVEENASGGTDHGTASNMFVIGSQLKKKGIFNEVPDLVNLVDGDLKHHIDFRQVYATVLDKWLKADSANILGEQFLNLGFL